MKTKLHINCNAPSYGMAYLKDTKITFFPVVNGGKLDIIKAT